MTNTVLSITSSSASHNSQQLKNSLCRWRTTNNSNNMELTDASVAACNSNKCHSSNNSLIPSTLLNRNLTSSQAFLQAVTLVVSRALLLNNNSQSPSSSSAGSNQLRIQALCLKMDLLILATSAAAKVASQQIHTNSSNIKTIIHLACCQWEDRCSNQQRLKRKIHLTHLTVCANSETYIHKIYLFI